MAEQQPEQYIEARVAVPRVHTDAVCDFIIEHFTGGLILEDEEGSDQTVITYYVPESLGDKHSFELSQYLTSILPADTSLPEIKTRRIENIEWVQQYRDSLEPLIVAADVVIRPPWFEPPADVTYDIIIEPKMAFGTGSHETTRSCMGAVRRVVKQDDRFLDLGCGSGILSILADKLGAGYIRAIDYDAVAVDNTIENFALNNVTTPNEPMLGSIEQAHAEQPYDVVVANIIKITILPWIDQLVQLTKPGGYLILSGLLEADVEEISAGLHAVGQKQFEIIPDNAWRTYLLTRT